MSDATLTRPDADEPFEPLPIDAHPTQVAITPPAERPADVLGDSDLASWGFALATAGRLWLALVTGMLLIATVPAVLLPGWSAHVVVSGSMAPRINTGDVVISQDRDDYQPGQVIVFDDADRGAVTHRLQSIDGETFTTKGDANPTADSSPVARDDVLGLGRLLVMFAGLPWVWYHTSQWLPLALFILSLLLASWAVARDRPYAIEPRRSASATLAGSEPGDPDPLAESPGAGDCAIPLVAALESAGSTGGATEARDGDPTSAVDVATNPRGRRARFLIPTAVAAVVALAFIVSSIPGTSAAFSATTANTGNTWTAAISAPPTTYASSVLADNPYVYLRLNEPQPSGTSQSAANAGTSSLAYDYTRSGTFASSFLLGGTSTANANLTPSPNSASSILKDSACILAPSTLGSLSNPQSFTIEAWIRSTGNAGGKIIGFERERTGQASQYDRHLYQDQSGFVNFGIYNNSNTALTIQSPAPLNDGVWHHVMGTLTSAAGTMRLYVDGVEAPTSPRTNITAEVYSGWWRVGCGNLNGWPTGTPALTGVQSFIGAIDEPAAHQTALTAADAAERWSIGKP